MHTGHSTLGKGPDNHREGVSRGGRQLGVGHPVEALPLTQVQGHQHQGSRVHPREELGTLSLASQHGPRVHTIKCYSIGDGTTQVWKEQESSEECFINIWLFIIKTETCDTISARRKTC